VANAAAAAVQIALEDAKWPKQTEVEANDEDMEAGTNRSYISIF
jgi:hypothetical protein